MDKETKFQIEVIKEQARILWATTVVSWFATLKYKIYKPFRNLRTYLEDKVVEFVDGRKARKQAHETYMYSVLLKAAEDCVVIHAGDRTLMRDVLKFDATRELSPLLKSALHEYLRTHKYSSTYGTLLEKALKKDPHTLPGVRILSNGSPIDRRITKKERYWKTVRSIEKQRHQNKHGMSSFEKKMLHLENDIRHMKTKLKLGKDSVAKCEAKGEDVSKSVKVYKELEGYIAKKIIERNILKRGRC